MKKAWKYFSRKHVVSFYWPRKVISLAQNETVTASCSFLFYAGTGVAD